MTRSRVRKQAYWSYLAGGYHTYGNTNTWNFGSFKAERTQDWKQALRSPGAAHLSVLTKLLVSIEWWKLVPDSSVFVEGMGSGETRHAAMRSTAGDRLLVYLSHPGTVSLRLDGITATSVAQATWVDPQTGIRTAIGQFPTPGKSSFSSPKGWPDAMLLRGSEERLRPYGVRQTVMS